MYAHVTVTCAYLTYFIVKLISMQKCHVSSIEFLLKLGRGVQEDKKNPTKQTNKLNKTKITQAKKCQKQRNNWKKSYFMVLRKNNDYFSM